MTHKKFHFSLLIPLLALAFGFGAQHVQAATNTGAQYTVSPVIPDNQRTSVSSYFDLVVKPGTKQPLSVVITNKSNVARHLKLSLTTAYTQTNGLIGYKPGGPRDSSAQYRLSELGTSTPDVTLAPNATKKITTTVNIPAKGFKGVLLGGLYIVDKQKDAGGKTNGIKIKNEFATLIGVQLQTSTGAMNYIKPNLKLKGVAAGIQDNQPGVLATIQNPTATYWGKMHYTAKVYRRNSDTVVMKNSRTNYSIAPNSHFDYGILQKKALNPGDYTLDLRVTGPHGQWHWRRNFSILTAQADKINKKLHLKRQFVMPWWGWLLIVLAVALLLWLIIFLIRRHKRNKAANTQQ